MNIDVTGMKSSVHFGAVRKGREEENPSATMSMNLSSASWKTKGNIEPSSAVQILARAQELSSMYCCLYYGGVCSEEKCNYISPL